MRVGGFQGHFLMSEVPLWAFATKGFGIQAIGCLSSHRSFDSGFTTLAALGTQFAALGKGPMVVLGGGSFL